MNADKKTARIAGVLYLILFIAGIFAGITRESMVAPGDATATTNNLLAAEGLLRVGIAADLIMILADVALALLFYILLKPVSRALSLMAAFFRLAQAATLGINLLNLFIVLQLLSGAAYLTVFSPEQMQALGFLFFKAHGIGYSIGLIFFGVYLLLLAYLIYRSSYFPRFLSFLLALAGLSYLIDSFSFMYPDYAVLTAQLMVIPTVIAELSLILWLLIKGINVKSQDQRPSLRPIQAEGAAS